MITDKEIYLDINGNWKKADTSSPEWEKYYAAKKAFDERMTAEKPHPKNFKSVDEYAWAVLKWRETKALDAPNHPGYYRANND